MTKYYSGQHDREITGDGVGRGSESEKKGAKQLCKHHGDVRVAGERGKGHVAAVAGLLATRSRSDAFVGTVRIRRLYRRRVVFASRPPSTATPH